jgi:hypothetical protein
LISNIFGNLGKQKDVNIAKNIFKTKWCLMIL